MKETGDIRFLGVDAGGSGVRAGVADGSGVILHDVMIDTGGNQNKIGTDVAVGRILTAISKVRRGIGMGGERFDAAVFGIAGCDSQADRTLYAGLFGRETNRIKAVNDVELAFDGPGAVVTAGSGSNCMYRSDMGKTFQAGGNGLFLDQGGGTWFARHAFGALMDVMDGLGDVRRDDWRSNSYAASMADMLEAAVRSTPAAKLKTIENPVQFEINEKADVHKVVYREPYLTDTQGEGLHRLFAPHLFDCAELNESGGVAIPEAIEIIKLGAVSLARQIGACFEPDGASAGYRSTDLAVMGKVLIRRQLYRDYLVGSMADRGIEVARLRIVDEPLQGAVRMAMELFNSDKE